MVDRSGFELILGSSIDPQFGPVLLFGVGGTLVEVFRDRALGLPPLTATLARRMMEQTRIYAALQGVRGQDSVDMAGLEQLLVRFSELVVEQPAIAEIDINPLLASPERLLALDARVILHPGDVSDPELPRPAIRPYPRQYVGTWTTDDGALEYTIRPIRPEDESLVVEFHGRLSNESVYQRYFTKMGYEQRVAHERLVRVCFTDYDREIALVAEVADPESGRVVIGSVGRLIRLPGTDSAEFSLIVADDHQGRGLGTQMLSRLIDVAREEGIGRVVAEILAANGSMVSICRELGFEISTGSGGDTVQAELSLPA
jgi:acetyltransferase